MLRARVPAFKGSGERHVPEQWLSDAGDTGAIKKLRHVWGLVVNCATYMGPRLGVVCVAPCTLTSVVFWRKASRLSSSSKVNARHPCR